MEMTDISALQGTIQDTLITAIGSSISDRGNDYSIYDNALNSPTATSASDDDMDDLMNQIGLRVQRNGG